MTVKTITEKSIKHYKPVSTFILTTPLLTAVWISSLVEPEPPWKTRKLENIAFGKH